MCEHGSPQPWVTCIDCMSLPPDERPEPPRPEPPKPVAPAKPKAPPRPKRARAASSAPPAPRLPRSERDPLPELVGVHDLAYEIPPDDLRYYISGAEAGWLPISSVPRDLRAHGSVYLQAGRDLVARARVRGIGFRDRRWDHAAPEAATDLGPGATLELEQSWELVSIDLGAEGEVESSGYRYLVSLPDGTVRVASTD